MTSYTIKREIEIDAPIEVVWETITDPTRITTWFSDSAELDARPGTRGTLVFRPEGSSESTVVNITVVTADRPHTLAFRWAYPLDTEATADNSMLVTFTLTADGAERTQLQVVETGLEALDWPDDDKRTYVEQHRHGWTVNGDRLRALFVAPHEPPQ